MTRFSPNQVAGVKIKNPGLSAKARRERFKKK
jgi:hypothetical protein